MTNEIVEKLIKNLEKRIEFHRKNQNDPHGIGNAVLAVLYEIVDSLKESIK